MLRPNSFTRGILAVVLCFALTQVAAGRIIYVDADAPGRNSGLSWADAFTDLRDALLMARPGDEIRVAPGVYTPAAPPNGKRGDSFLLQEAQGATIRGGYAGFGEPDPDARDIVKYRTILSGDLNGDDGLNFANNGENSYHVIDSSSTNELTILDGFTITGGNADSRIHLEPPYVGWEEAVGGGIYNIGGSPTIIDCNFIANFALEGGGGMYNAPNHPSAGEPPIPSNPKLIHCKFTKNSADFGSGIYNENSSPVLNCCGFIANRASYGGGMFINYRGSIVLTSCIFNGNEATLGGGMLIYDSNATLINCTFKSNSASNFAGGIHNVMAATTLTNCILWANTDSSGMYESAQIYGGTPNINYCCVQGWSIKQLNEGHKYLFKPIVCRL